jgi:hypothetical protein
MKYLMLLIYPLLLINSPVFAQDESSPARNPNLEKQQQREAKKEHNKKVAMENLVHYDSLLQTKSWVVEANTIYNRYNEAFPVNSSLNFVSLNDSLLTIQLSLSNTMPGSNGVGGLTFDGKLTRYNISSKKNNDLFLHCSSMASLVGSSDLFINVYSNGRASVKITDNWGNRYSFEGYIVPYRKSRVFKGMTSF